VTIDGAILDGATGLGERARAIAGGFDARLAAARDDAWRALSQAGMLHAEARLPSLSIPQTFGEWLSHALALEEDSPSGRGAQLDRHYLDYMPRMRVEQLGTRAHPNAKLFHAPLDWHKLPRLSSAIDRLFALVGDALAPSADDFRAARPTLAALYQRAYYGGFMPLLYGYPADLRALARALDGGADLHALVDGRLAAPIVHELSHLQPGRAAALPPYLDECLAAYVGSRALAETAWPGDGEDALYGAPWLMQTGQALARATGGAVLDAHAGRVAWSRALSPALASALVRLGWDEYRATRDSHFLTSNYRPEPWIKLFFLAAAGGALGGVTLDSLDALAWGEIPVGDETDEDARILADALRACCVDNFQVDLAYRVRRAPPAGPIAIDCARCRVTAAGGKLDPRGLAYFLPPAVAARLRQSGIAGYTVELRALDALDEIDEIGRAILDGAPSRERASYSLSRRAL